MIGKENSIPYVLFQSRQTLKKAQEVYGIDAQVMVVIEELCELITVVCKPVSNNGFKDVQTVIAEQRDFVIDEVADAYVVLEHLCMIFKLDELRNITECSKVKSFYSLTEMVCVLSKYIRYHDKDKAMVEIKPRVELLLEACYKYVNFIARAYNIESHQVAKRITSKVTRVAGWLEKTTDFQQSTVDRTLVEV